MGIIKKMKQKLCIHEFYPYSDITVDFIGNLHSIEVCKKCGKTFEFVYKVGEE